MLNMEAINHYATVILNERGEAVRGFDYLHPEDAELQRQKLESEGHRVEVWARNVFGERLKLMENTVVLARKTCA